jgi:hypothetical protein
MAWLAEGAVDETPVAEALARTLPNGTFRLRDRQSDDSG